MASRAQRTAPHPAFPLDPRPSSPYLWGMNAPPTMITPSSLYRPRAPGMLINEAIDACRAHQNGAQRQFEPAQEEIEFKAPRVLRA